MRTWTVAKNLWLSLIFPIGSWAPKTPIRWLCLKAFVYLAQAQSKKLRTKQADHLCQAVELGVYLNRCFDGKQAFHQQSYRQLRRGLPQSPTKRYLAALKTLELSRPQAANWKAIREYRRGVLATSLSFLLQLTDLEHTSALLPLCSLVQLVDDVLDQEIDKNLSLPTFLVAGGPRSTEIARAFWKELSAQKDPNDLPLVLGGHGVYLFTRFIILINPLITQVRRLPTKATFAQS